MIAEQVLKSRAVAMLDSYGDRMPFQGQERQLVVCLMAQFACDAVVHELVELTGLSPEDVQAIP